MYLLKNCDNGTIYYLTPSTATQQTAAGTEISGGTLFNRTSFKVAGKKVALVRSSYRVTIFDAAANALTDIPGNSITLNPFVIPTAAYEPGHMASDNTLIATINDTSEVTDGNAIKVIDVSGTTPNIIGLPTPATFEGSFDQVAVDATTHRVAAHGDNPGEKIFVWNVDNPTAAPLAFDVSNDGFQDSVQLQIDGDYIIYAQGNDKRALLNVTTGTTTKFNYDSTNPNLPVAIAGDSFGYFMFDETADMTADGLQFRSVIGEVADAPGGTTAGQLDQFASPSACVTGGIAGYGRSMGITSDGERWFIAGLGPINRSTSHLQMSTGARFETFDDDETQTGTVMASDLTISQNTVAFRALRQNPNAGCITDDDEVIAFIVINRLD